MREIINKLMEDHEPEDVLGALVLHTRDFSEQLEKEHNKDAAFFYKLLSQKIEEAYDYAKGK